MDRTSCFFPNCVILFSVKAIREVHVAVVCLQEDRVFFSHLFAVLCGHGFTSFSGFGDRVVLHMS